jgi:diguanylate cyclase (GGDEF)-like protein
MPEIVDRLADLTEFRDRDIADVTLVGAFRDLLQPLSVAVFRAVGEPGNERWHSRARLGAGDAVASSDSMWADLEGLPLLAEFPLREQVLRLGRPTSVAGQTHLALYPLATDQEVVAVLELETTQPLDERDRGLVASVLRIHRNFQGLLDYSERDTLTGLLNRKTFDNSFMKISAAQQAAAAELADDRRGAGPSVGHWLAVVDIDHFKRVNDNFGHLIGDEVLLLLARLMRGSFRFSDRLYRFGGEEFVVLVRCADHAAAAMVFERLRANTEHYAFPQVGRLTVSVGFTEVKPGDTPSGAFERADKAVYYAKSHGRNQVRSHAELVSGGELEDGSKVGDVELF